MYALKLFTLLILFSSLLFSTIYENASSKKTDKWHVLKHFSSGAIKNIYDKKKKSRVIKFEGNSTKSAYILMPKKKSFKQKKGENIFQWEMNFSEDFVIMIGLYTLKGKRYLIYTSGDKDSYLQYGLGSDSTSGQWKKYSRNLQEDLENSDRYNKIISVNSFVIKGSGMIDNIKMIKSKRAKVPKEKTIKKIEKKNDKKVKESIVKKVEVNKSTQPPNIYIKGDNPMVLKKGERYIEKGAIAKNRDGSSVPVTISEDIDIFTDGEYSVIYMATNSAGDTAVDRRRVIVGTLPKEKEKKIIDSSDKIDNNVEIPSEVEDEDENVDLEQRALDILDWEKQLALREEELNRDKNSPTNYPSHPGL